MGSIVSPEGAGVRAPPATVPGNLPGHRRRVLGVMDDGPQSLSGGFIYERRSFRVI